MGEMVNLKGELNERKRHGRQLHSIKMAWTVKPAADDVADID